MEGPFTVQMPCFDDCAYTFTVREIKMMRIKESITDKPNWHKKMAGGDVANDLDISEEMKTYIIKELQWKVTEFQRTGLVTAYDSAVVKSDIAISCDLQQRLRDAVKTLEDVPEEEEDYHPSSYRKVLDLVHLSLFPLVYGRTRVLRDTLIRTDNCLLSLGHRKPIKLHNHQGPEHDRGWNVNDLSPYSQKFQWLPCIIEFGIDGQCQIASYINNLHPIKHRDLYHVIENILDETIPLWMVSLVRRRDIPNRISYSEVEYLPSNEPEPERENSDDKTYWERLDDWRMRRLLKQPEPGEFRPSRDVDIPVDLQAQFRDKGLQVIVKLANVELSPDKPEYDGGAWHIEGQLNITSHALGFRHRIHEEDIAEFVYEQYEWTFFSVFGMEHDGGDLTSLAQDLGGVSCQQGRLLKFPNTLQHRVPPFSLAGRSKPGYRKILVLFLIDPNLRIISTAMCPAKRRLVH
ncbi:hypothetical protein BDW69DRAFT_195405 [Aspergillus filifer]